MAAFMAHCVLGNKSASKFGTVSGPSSHSSGKFFKDNCCFSNCYVESFKNIIITLIILNNKINNFLADVTIAADRVKHCVTVEVHEARWQQGCLKMF